MQWLQAVDVGLALTNCHYDMLGDWYRDPWSWHELDWVVQRKSELVNDTLGGHDARRLSPMDVPKEDFGMRPAVVMHPLDRLAYQALVDAISLKLNEDLRPWVYGWRLPRSEPTRAWYVPNGKEWEYYRKRLRRLAQLHPVALQTDVVSFFASVSIERLNEHVRSRVSNAVVEKLHEMLATWARTLGRPGLPQRCLGSSVLANFFLASVDDTIEQCAPVPTEAAPFAGAARWMDDIWVSGSDRGDVRRCQVRLERTARDLGLNLGTGKTKVLEANELRKAAWIIEHGYVDVGLDTDPSSIQPLEQLVAEIIEAPESASRTTIRFATTRIKNAGDSQLAGKIAAVAHRMPHGADHLARLIRDMGLWATMIDWYAWYRSSSWAIEWSVAQLGTMFPASAKGVSEVAEVFKAVLPTHPSLPLVAVAAHRLAVWQPAAARDLLRETAPRAADPLERRILGLAALTAREERGIVERLLGEFEENRVTVLMLKDRHFRPPDTSKDFAG